MKEEIDSLNEQLTIRTDYESDSYMKLIEIEKQLYRKRLNHIIICFVSSFAILSLVFGSLLITLFSEPNNDNFKLKIINNGV